MDNPKHVAIIMDGNRRWAQEHGIMPTSGHRVGADTLVALCTGAVNMGLEYLTVYAFSTENFKRSPVEVKILMDLITEYMKICREMCLENNIRFRSIGDRSALPDKLIREIELTEKVTGGDTGMVLTIAINYGGRDDLLRAFKKMMQCGIDENNVSEDVIASHLDTAGTPDPDLVIRTSGEYRLSNFLLWQSAYSELCFTDKYWPDYTVEDLKAAIEQYQSRTRRFGGSV